MDANYQGKTVLIAGAARSGIAAARFLARRGARVVLSDAQKREALEPAISELVADMNGGELILELGGNRPESFACCDLVVVSPGMSLALPLFDISRKAGIPIIGEIELAWRHLRGRILAVTGSNGKTTTTTLLGKLLAGAGLRVHTAGNIGTPLIQFAEESTALDLYAVELSSFQLESIQGFRPSGAALLNLTPDHLDRYHDFAAYIAAKSRIFQNQKATDFAVLNADDPRTAALADNLAARVFYFSLNREVPAGAFIRAGRAIFRDDRGEIDLFPVTALRLKGGHNLENALAASILALGAGAAPASLESSLRDFRGVEHRLEYVATVDGVDYYNDSKATNVDATIKALDAFPGNIHLIAGGRDKAGDFAVLRQLVGERVKEMVLIGEAAEKLRLALTGATTIKDATSLPEAISMCRATARSGDVVLLAPACASFDMFDDYEHRGRVFKAAVLELTRVQPN